MDIVKIDTSKAAAPSGWYSQAFKVGDLIFCSGVVANDPCTQELVAPGDIMGQTEQILKNLEQILLAAGSDLSRVVKVQAFVKDIDEFDRFNEVYKRYFPTDPPPRSPFQIGKFLGDVVVEIEAVAVAFDVQDRLR